MALALSAPLPCLAQEEAFPVASNDRLLDVLADTVTRGGTAEALQLACETGGCALERAFYFSSASESQVRNWLRNKREQLPFSRFAATTVDSRSHAIVLVRGADVGSLLDLRRASSLRRLILRLDDGLEDPVLYTMNIRGEVQARALSRAEYNQGPSDEEAWLEVPSNVARIQVVARSRVGTVPVVTTDFFPTRVERQTVNAAQPLETILSVRRLVRRTTRVRGTVDLRENALLRDLAQTRAAQTCQSNQLVHQTRVGPPDAFLQQHGLASPLVGETLAIDVSTEAAWQRLMESPSHRFALLQHRFTDIGIGVMHDGERVCVAVLLAERPRAVPASRLSAANVRVD